MLFIPAYNPFAIFTVPPFVTVFVAFLIDFFASSHVEPSLSSFPDEPFT
ncbi:MULTISPECIES: hypothetical protein [Methanobacterium]|nr:MULTISPECIES: hypothetical protein [Methanobacterium]